MPRVSIPTSPATQLVGPDSLPQGFLVSNLDATNPIYVGGQGVTSSTGQRIPAGAVETYPKWKEAMYAVSTGGTVAVNVTFIPPGCEILSPPSSPGTGGGGGGTAGTPNWNDQGITTLAASNTGDPLVATGLSATPIGGVVDVYNDGGQRFLVSDGDKTQDIYFSGDGGTTARARTAIVSGDIEYLGDRGAAAGGVGSGGKLSRRYNS